MTTDELLISAEWNEPVRLWWDLNDVSMCLEFL